LWKFGREKSDENFPKNRVEIARKILDFVKKNPTKNKGKNQWKIPDFIQGPRNPEIFWNFEN
jgi:hypothetical protein